MKEQINVVEIMESIKAEIKAEGISVADQHLATSYYKKRMEEIRNQEQIIIFGVGGYGNSLYRMLEKEKVSNKVVCFCDNSIAMQNTRFRDLDILSVKDALAKYPNAYFVITPKIFGNEILRQLVKEGVEIDKISIYVSELTGLEV